MINRRSALAVLGLAGSASGAAAVEALGAATDQEQPCTVSFAVPTKETMARALRLLSDEIMAGRAYVASSSLVTEIKPDEFLLHKFSIDFHLVNEK